MVQFLLELYVCVCMWVRVCPCVWGGGGYSGEHSFDLHVSRAQIGLSSQVIFSMWPNKVLFDRTNLL